MGVMQSLLRGGFCLLGLWSASFWAQPGQTHTVQRKETAFGIARQYNVDLNALFELNPWAEAGLRKGDVLRIPAQWKAEVTKGVDSTDAGPGPDDGVQDGVSPDGMNPALLVSAEEPRRRPVPPTWIQDTIRVAVFLPFHAGRDSLGRQEARLQQIARDCAAGIRLALDSQQVSGAHFDVRFLDTGQDTAGVMLCSASDLWSDAPVDLALGPLRRSRFQEIRKWPVMSTADHCAMTDLGRSLAENEVGVIMPFVDVEERMNGLARYVAQSHRGERILLLATGDIRNLRAEDAFRTAWSALAAEDSLLMMSEVEVQSKGLGFLRDSLTDVRRNVLVVPGGKANRSLAGVLQTEMQLGDTMEFRLYADMEWKDFSFLDFNLRERVGFTVVDDYASLPDSSLYGPVDSSYFCLARSMSNLRGADAGKYGWLAHDMMREAMSWSAGHGPGWSRRCAAQEPLVSPFSAEQGLIPFDWRPAAEKGGGIINGAVRIMRQEDYRWLEVARYPDNP